MTAAADLAPAGQATLASLVAAHSTQFILATFTTLTGKPCAKLIPASAVEDFQTEGCGFAGYAAGAMGQVPADPDIVALPDPGSFTPLPFIRPGLAMVHCDPHVNGQPYPYAPRVILRRQLDRLAALGMTLSVGAEVEYFLVQKNPDGSICPADEADNASQPCYDARGVTRMYDHLSAVSEAMEHLGWGPYASDHEDGNGQFEQNFHYADAMVTADRVTTLRYIIQMLAEARGMTATFMPKPFADRTGSGLHFHMSLWGDEGPRFPSSGADDAHGLGLSALGYGFVAGLVEHAPALQALIAPTVNSYKRTRAASTSSGASWAPRAATYGGNDRTHLIRVPDEHRIELRAGDGAASSHLAIAAALGAGLDGVERGLDPGAPGARPEGAPLLPRTLLDAIGELDRDPVMRAVLDSADPSGKVSAYYAELKRNEFYDWHAQVTDWELRQYLTAV